MLVWGTRCCIVWLGQVIRNISQTSECVGERAQGTCEVTSWLQVLSNIRLFVKELVEFPEACEAFLAAEVGWLQAELDASGALHCGWLATVGCLASSLSRFLGHLRFLLLSLLLLGICLYHSV